MANSAITSSGIKPINISGVRGDTGQAAHRRPPLSSPSRIG